MSIEQNWKQLNDEKDDDLSLLLQAGQIAKINSSNPLEKIRRLMLASLIWCVLISLFYVFILIRFPLWQILVCIGLVLLFNIWVGHTAWVHYKRISTSIKTSRPLLAELETHYTSIKNWMDLQMKVSIFVYPFAATGGFLLGGMLGSGKSIDFFISKPSVIIALIITLIILVPCCVVLARWMLRKSFGKHLTVLKKNIDALKDDR